jgi:hypothetical protein
MGDVKKQPFTARGKGNRHFLPERPFGCFAQKVPVAFSAAIFSAALPRGCERLRQKQEQGNSKVELPWVHKGVC